MYAIWLDFITCIKVLEPDFISAFVIIFYYEICYSLEF